MHDEPPPDGTAALEPTTVATAAPPTAALAAACQALDRGDTAAVESLIGAELDALLEQASPREGARLLGALGLARARDRPREAMLLLGRALGGAVETEGATVHAEYLLGLAVCMDRLGQEARADASRRKAIEMLRDAGPEAADERDPFTACSARLAVELLAPGATTHARLLAIVLLAQGRAEAERGHVGRAAQLAEAADRWARLAGGDAAIAGPLLEAQRLLSGDRLEEARTQALRSVGAAEHAGAGSDLLPWALATLCAVERARGEGGAAKVALERAVELCAARGGDEAHETTTLRALLARLEEVG